MNRDDIMDFEDDYEETFIPDEGDVAEELNFSKEESDDDFPSDVDECDEEPDITEGNMAIHLRNDIMILEPFRKPRAFVYKGKTVKLVPMAELKNNRFVFKTDDGSLTAISLSDLRLP